MTSVQWPQSASSGPCPLSSSLWPRLDLWGDPFIPATPAVSSITPRAGPPWLCSKACFLYLDFLRLSISRQNPSIFSRSHICPAFLWVLAILFAREYKLLVVLKPEDFSIIFVSTLRFDLQIVAPPQVYLQALSLLSQRSATARRQRDRWQVCVTL